MAGGKVGAKGDHDVAAAVEAEDQGVELVGHEVAPFHLGVISPPPLSPPRRLRQPCLIDSAARPA
jgi:hypothetical protein